MVNWLRIALLALCLAAPASPAAAADPAPAAALDAAPLLDAALLDLDDRPVPLRSLRGATLVVLHQDKKSSEQSAAFKDRLGELAARHPQRLRVVALAEVGGYNFWPARRFVKDALRPLRDGGGALVLCDWKGAVRKRYGIGGGQSAVFVVSRDGELKLLQRGLFGAAEAAAALALIEKLVND